MIILRKMEIETDNLKIGDQITIQLNDFGDFTATAQQITKDGAVFMFDEYVTSRPMNLTSTNEGGFEKSDLRKWMNDILFPAFPKSMQGKIKNLTIPTYGQIFGYDRYNLELNLEPDDNEQFPLMTKRINRVTDFNNDNWSNFLKRFEPGWLQNRILPELPRLIQPSSSKGKSHFAVVTNTGEASSLDATDAAGVRPVFLLVE